MSSIQKQGKKVDNQTITIFLLGAHISSSSLLFLHKNYEYVLNTELSRKHMT